MMVSFPSHLAALITLVSLDAVIVFGSEPRQPGPVEIVGRIGELHATIDAIGSGASNEPTLGTRERGCLL